MSLYVRSTVILCRVGPVCPAASRVLFPAGRCGHRPLRKDRRTCRITTVGDGVLQWSAAEQMPLGYDVPSARQRRAVIPSQYSHWRGNPSPRRGGRLCPPRIPAAKNTFAPRPVPAAQKSDRQAPVTWLYRWNRCLYSSKYWAKEWDFMARTLDRYSWVSKESDSSSMMATATLEQWSATRS